MGLKSVVFEEKHNAHTASHGQVGKSQKSKELHAVECIHFVSCFIYIYISIGGYRRLGSSAKCALLLLEYRNET